MAFAIIITLLTVAVLVDVLTRTDDQIKYLPKIGWFIVVLLFPIVGSLVWLLAGRVWGPLPTYTPLGDPSRSTAQPDTFPTTEQELAALDAEIAFHEKQARLARLEAELAEKRKRAEG